MWQKLFEEIAASDVQDFSLYMTRDRKFLLSATRVYNQYLNTNHKFHEEATTETLHSQLQKITKRLARKKLRRLPDGGLPKAGVLKESSREASEGESQPLVSQTVSP